MAKKLGKKILFYTLIAAAVYLGFIKYQSYVSHQYLNEFRALKGEETVEHLAGLYKEIIDYQSTYKLTPQTQANLVQAVLKTGKQLKDIDNKLKAKYPERHIDFSYVYQDLFLVVKQIQDKANDAKLSAMVVHAVEGLGNLKVQLYMTVD
ncbi:hypothetical protein [Aneurinibacillus terranovensis]|uniref:hypothetical protein n=1 Tax=Aneurinibacillus terranovensis TaxID=278991 RepID=UPI000415315D|nr:hypothetical protein [Aneurinibacillus terranovensis]